MIRNPSHSLSHNTLPRVGGLLRQMVAALFRAPALARQRRALMALDDRLLSDIGYSRDAAEAEAARPLLSAAWDAPRHWRC